MAKRILLVDDDPYSRASIDCLLACEGYEVMQAANGREALTLLTAAGDSEPFDLIVADLVMPNISGLDLARHLLTENIRTPVMLITALFDPITFLEIQQFGHRDLMTKPFRPNDFIGYVAELISADNKTGKTGSPVEVRAVLG